MCRCPKYLALARPDLRSPPSSPARDPAGCAFQRSPEIAPFSVRSNILIYSMVDGTTLTHPPPILNSRERNLKVDRENDCWLPVPFEPPHTVPISFLLLPKRDAWLVRGFSNFQSISQLPLQFISQKKSGFHRFTQWYHVANWQSSATISPTPKGVKRDEQTKRVGVIANAAKGKPREKNPEKGLA
jgi:hypothetical protein